MKSREEPMSDLTAQAVAAMQAAVAEVVAQHRKEGRPLVLWRDGQVVFEMPQPDQAPDAPPKETP